MANQLDDDQPVYVISVASELSGLHPQTLRQYERLGLVSPDRTGGRNRRYSMSDIVRLREVQDLASEGLNLAGIQRVLELQAEVDRLRARLAQNEREKTSTALVVWRPQRRR
jgi:MerR family transcriptional regulator/heat shock protein HspR